MLDFPAKNKSNLAAINIKYLFDLNDDDVYRCYYIRNCFVLLDCVLERQVERDVAYCNTPRNIYDDDVSQHCGHCEE